jgi:hypothetical protein
VIRLGGYGKWSTSGIQGGLGLGMIIDAMWIIGRDERKRKKRKNEI